MGTLSRRVVGNRSSTFDVYKLCFDSLCRVSGGSYDERKVLR